MYAYGNMNSALSSSAIFTHRPKGIGSISVLLEQTFSIFPGGQHP
jgi:hypothetical protein